MGDTMVELYTELENRRSKFINWLEFNINDKTVLDAAVSYFEMEESVRKATLKPILVR